MEWCVYRLQIGLQETFIISKDDRKPNVNCLVNIYSYFQTFDHNNSVYFTRTHSFLVIARVMAELTHLSHVHCQYRPRFFARL